MVVGVARHGSSMGMAMSLGAIGQGIILRRRPIGRGWSSAGNATGRGKVRRLVPDQAPGQWAFELQLALASPGLGSLLFDSCRSCLPCKRPRLVSSSPRPPSFLSSFPHVSHQVKQPAHRSISRRGRALPVSYRGRVATCQCFQVLACPTQYNRDPKSSSQLALTARPNKRCPHFFRLPLETAPLTDHRDTIIFPPVRHRALRVRTKLSVPSHPRPAPQTVHRQRQADSHKHPHKTCSLSKALLYLLTLRHPHGWTESTQLETMISS